MNFAHAGGLRIAYESFGREDDPAILLVAGLGTQMVRWSDAFCQGLVARGFRVVRFDNRDSGLSTHLAQLPPPDFGALAAALGAGRVPAVPYTLREMAADAVGLLDSLHLGRAHVVGRSMGWMIAQIVATDHPGRVSSLTSIMASTGNPALPGAEPEVMAMMMRPRPDPVSDPEGYVAAGLAFARRIAGPIGFDAAVQAATLREELRRGHDLAGTARQLAAMAVAGDRRAALATIAAPTLVVHGTDDPLIPLACGADTAAVVPGARWLPIEGMGHDLPPSFEPAVVEAIAVLAA